MSSDPPDLPALIAWLEREAAKYRGPDGKDLSDPRFEEVIAALRQLETLKREKVAETMRAINAENVMRHARARADVAEAQVADLTRQLQSQGAAIRKLAEKWRDAAVWEHDDMSNMQSAQTFDQCANELDKALAGGQETP